jgi:glycosyltransferase involved in cell wall biosynthesis
MSSANPKVLMLGWELPPFNSGGLGVACYGLAKSLAKKGANITFVLPKRVDLHFDFMNLDFANVNDPEEKMLKAYSTMHSWLVDAGVDDQFPSDFVSGALEYAEKIKKIAMKVKPDVIHAHDWLTFPAAIAAKEATGKPVVMHVHSTEHDRTGGNIPNPMVFNIEKEGLKNADKVISISNLQIDLLRKLYNLDRDKIELVYNGASVFKSDQLPPALTHLKKAGYKVVLFLGRITLQKGPEYFVRAATKVLEYDKKVAFVVTGSGEMVEQMIGEVRDLGIMDNFIFTGFLRDQERDRILQAADLYVMPSVSEPFGIVPLEAIAHETPVLLSKQCGVAEILNHVLKTDFWDIDEMANMILAVLQYGCLHDDLVWESGKELPNINWDRSADQCMKLYRKLI